MKPFSRHSARINASGNPVINGNVKDILPNFNTAVVYFDSETTNQYENTCLEFKDISIDEFVSAVEKKLQQFEQEDDIHIVYVKSFNLEIIKDGLIYNYDKTLDIEFEEFCEAEVLAALGFTIHD